jgi:DNA-binding transcriptional regulator LsrR (DeoR family)
MERLLALVSRLYFDENKSQSDIKDDPEVRTLYGKAAGGRRGDDQTLSQATVNRLLRRARERGVVSISIDASFTVTAIREQELSRRMRNGFRLRECYALRPQSDETAGDAPQGEPDDDRLILCIVNFTAQEIGRALDPGDHVLCAGGRTICWLARAVRRNPPSKRGLIFTPLSGRLWVEEFKTGDADIMERPLDADDAVHIFSEAFEDEPEGRFSQINQPLYCNAEDPEDTAAAIKVARGILSNHCAIGPDGSWNWNLPEAVRAYVGVGSLESGSHRLAIFLRDFEAGVPSARESYLAAAGPSLLRINNLCKDARLPLPGDMGNRLFPCLKLPTELMALGDRSQLNDELERMANALKPVTKEIDELNARAVVMSWKHLRRTRGVRVICAGQSKRRALMTVLLAGYFDCEQGATPLVKELTTDHATATSLCAELEVLQSDRDLCAWYAERIRDFGLLAGAQEDAGSVVS